MRNDSLISDSHRKLAAFLLPLKETAMCSREATKLKWTDLDEERRLITLNTPDKGSNPRIWKISVRLTGMLGALPKRNIYISKHPSHKSIILQHKKKPKPKTSKPRLLRISLHTFRH